MNSLLNKKIFEKNIFIRFAFFCLTLYICALLFNLFYNQLHLVIGGANGVAIIANEIFGISTSNVVIIVYIITLLFSFIFLGFKKSISLVLCTILYPLFVKLTSNITDYIHIDYSDPLLICIVAGVINGAMNGIIYKIGFNPGGLSVIAEIIYKYFHISVSKANFYISAAIILISGYYFGVDRIMYAIIVMYIITLVTDKVLLGISSNKYVYIVTDSEDKIEAFITKELGHGVTKLSCETGFNLRKKYVLTCSIPTSEYTLFKEGISLIDENAFMVVTDTYQSSGGL